METVLKILAHPDRKNRVLIVRRQNGMFGFEAEKWSDEPLELCWMRSTQNPFGLFDSAETAEREARAHIGWLDSMMQ